MLSLPPFHTRSLVPRACVEFVVSVWESLVWGSPGVVAFHRVPLRAPKTVRH